VSAKFFQLKSYFSYWLDAVDEHSLHSPFLFNFYINILKKKSPAAEVDALLNIRKRLLHDQRSIDVHDFGSGSLTLKTCERKVADITRVSTTPEKYATLYSRMIKHYQCRDIIELGTSVGINTMYLAKAHAATRVTTFEGSPETARVARQLFDENKIGNISLIEGNIDQTLPVFLESIKKFDFAFVDANHRFEPTKKYLEMLLSKSLPESIVVLDDIHYTAEMERAWKLIQQHELVYTTVDLYRCGLIFFNPALTKQNVVLQY
jgi:predicted O-methyltransferase YrrM